MVLAGTFAPWSPSLTVCALLVRLLLEPSSLLSLFLTAAGKVHTNYIFYYLSPKSLFFRLSSTSNQVAVVGSLRLPGTMPSRVAPLPAPVRYILH